MALATSGALSLNEIHVEVGGTSGTTCSLNDSDIRNITEASGKTINNTLGTTIDFNNFYGATNIPTWTISMTQGSHTVTGQGPNYGTNSSIYRGFATTNFSYTFSFGSLNDAQDTYYFDNNPIKAINTYHTSGDTIGTPGFQGLYLRVQKANATISNTDAGAFKTMAVTVSGSGSTTTLNRSDATFTTHNGGTDTSLHYNSWAWGSSYANQSTLGSGSGTTSIVFSRF